MDLPSLLRGLAELAENEDARERFLSRVRRLSRSAALEALKREGAPPFVIEHVERHWAAEADEATRPDHKQPPGR
jgi:hypothetical protein